MRRCPLGAQLENWNGRFPWDLWWRLQYRVPFGAPQHRAMRLLDIRAEYEQHLWLQRLRAQPPPIPAPPDPDAPLVAPPPHHEPSQAEIDAAFDAL